MMEFPKCENFIKYTLVSVKVLARALGFSEVTFIQQCLFSYSLQARTFRYVLVLSYTSRHLIIISLHSDLPVTALSGIYVITIKYFNVHSCYKSGFIFMVRLDFVRKYY